MQKVALLCVGAIKTRWITEGCTEYLRRLEKDVRLEVVEVPAGKWGDPPKQCEEESRSLLRALGRREGEVWVLDERGEQKTSEGFAGLLSAARDAGRPLIFIIGGAYGLNDAVRARADRVLRLSDMTLPHELCRVVFLEQLYRSQQIISHRGYHHV